MEASHSVETSDPEPCPMSFEVLELVGAASNSESTGESESPQGARDAEQSHQAADDLTYEDEDNDDDDEDLYADIEEAGRSAEHLRVLSELKAAKERNDALSKEMDSIKSHFQVLLKDRDQLEANMVLLYRTAKRELERKDKEIADMRSQQIGDHKRMRER
jgi:hypothetical protein